MTTPYDHRTGSDSAATAYVILRPCGCLFPTRADPSKPGGRTIIAHYQVTDCDPCQRRNGR